VNRESVVFLSFFFAFFRVETSSAFFFELKRSFFEVNFGLFTSCFLFSCSGAVLFFFYINIYYFIFFYFFFG